MGANQSDRGGLSYDPGRTRSSNNQTNKEYHHHPRVLDGQRKSKSKPIPPYRIKFQDITHNSITLSWQSHHCPDGHSIIAYTVEIASVGPGRDRQWRTLTKTCQGSTYDARHLDSNTGYMFRIRSENIYGIGKPSLPSEVCITKIYETLPTDPRSFTVSQSQSFHKYSEESTQSMKRHYSLHIGGGVKSMLNHSDIVIEPSLGMPNAQAVCDDSTKSQTLLRNNIHRTSLPANRKISAPIVLPGTANNSLYRLRESRRSLRTDTTDSNLKSSARDSGVSGLRGSLTVFDSSSLDLNFPPNSEDDCKKRSQDHRNMLPILSTEACTNSLDVDSGKGSKTSLCDMNKVDDNHSASISADYDLACDFNDVKTNNTKNVEHDNVNTSDTVFENTDDIYKLKEELKSLSLSDSKFENYEHENKGSEEFPTPEPHTFFSESLDSPWNRNAPIHDVSEQILAASLSDDVKMALYSRNNTEDQRFISECNNTLAGPKEANDFRTLRGVLQSNNMIVKTSRSLPDVVAVAVANGETRTGTKGKLTTIVDADEEDEANEEFSEDEISALVDYIRCAVKIVCRLN